MNFCIHVQENKINLCHFVWLHKYRYMYKDELDSMISIIYIFNINRLFERVPWAFQLYSGLRFNTSLRTVLKQSISTRNKNYN